MQRKSDVAITAQRCFPDRTPFLPDIEFFPHANWAILDTRQQFPTLLDQRATQEAGIAIKVGSKPELYDMLVKSRRSQ